MSRPWPTDSWEYVKRYDAEMTDGQSLVILAGYRVYAPSDHAADVTASVHFRHFLTEAGIPWGNVQDST